MKLGVAFCLAWAMVASSAQAEVAVKFASGHAITVERMHSILQSAADFRSLLTTEWGVEMAVKEIIEDHQLVAHGLAEGILQAEQPVEFGEPSFYTRRHAARVRSTLRRSCESEVEQQDLAQLFTEKQELFRIPRKLLLHRIKLPNAVEVEGQSAAEWLRSTAQGSSDHGFEPSTIERAQRTYNRETQGSLGWISIEPDEGLELFESGQKGDFLGPVDTGDFVSIFWIQDVVESVVPPWEMVANSARHVFVNACVDQSRKKIADESSYQAVSINMEAILASLNTGR